MEAAALWNDHALASLKDGRTDDAERGYEKALALLPDDAYLHNDVGILLQGLGRPDEAEATYRRATVLDPEGDTRWANLGDGLRKRRRTIEAIEAYGESSRLASDRWYDHRLWIGRIRGSL